MPIKFFPRDAIGKKPAKVGDVFCASFFGATRRFVVIEWYGDFFFAEMAE